MKNITISIDDEIYRRARIYAAERSLSVSALVRKYFMEITTIAEGETEFARLQREQNEIIAQIRQKHVGFTATENVARDELYRQ
ncbi:MAG: DUF6364 family protein [Anaerolineae bacterium]|nr:DUF6364 family protein [Anaerolineae bacterium]